MPGPLFSFAAYLGAVMNAQPSGIGGAALCLVAIYLPSFLLVIGAFPVRSAIRHKPHIRGCLLGLNATVMGLLAAALYRPVLTSAIHSSTDVAIALMGLVLLVGLKTPSWLVVLLTIAAAGLISV